MFKIAGVFGSGVPLLGSLLLFLFLLEPLTVQRLGGFLLIRDACWFTFLQLHIISSRCLQDYVDKSLCCDVR
jgi:hypothetical protein